MNNQRPAMGEQLLRSLLLTLAAMWLISYFFGWPGQQKQQTVERPPEAVKQATLATAFKGLDATKGVVLSSDAAKKEITTLQGKIAKNSTDDYAYWAHLRVGLLQQYIVKDAPAAVKSYEEVINHMAHDDIDAQAIFQKGDWQWRQAESLGATPGNEAAANTVSNTVNGVNLAPSKQDAVWTLEQLFHRGRSSAGFLDTTIFVPKLPQSTTASNLTQVMPPNSGPPALGFETSKIRELKGTLQEPHPQGVLDRINGYYGTTPLNKMMDFLVNLFGANPAYSYGLAIMLLAMLMRVVMQPINKKQYDSVKGMAAIGPEMKKIQEKYKAKPTDNPDAAREKQMKMFSEVRALQKAHGVNPQMGCMLAFIQIPVFIYFINPLMMHYEPKMALVGASFGWINNLALPDYLLLGLYGLSMLLSFRLSATPATDEMQRQVQLMTTFVFPIMLPFFMKGFSSAFILYWMVFNFVSMIFQYRMMKAGDPNKSFLKTLIGDGLIPKPITPEGSAPAEEVVPPRPKKSAKSSSSTKAVKPAPLTVVRSEEIKEDGGSRNGKASLNGSTHDDKSTLNGTAVLDPELSSEDDAGSKKSDSASQNASQRSRRRRRF